MTPQSEPNIEEVFIEDAISNKPRPEPIKNIPTVGYKGYFEKNYPSGLEKLPNKIEKASRESLKGLINPKPLVANWEEPTDWGKLFIGIFVLLVYTALVIFITWLVMQHRADERYINQLRLQNPWVGVR